MLRPQDVSEWLDVVSHISIECLRTAVLSLNVWLIVIVGIISSFSCFWVTFANLEHREFESTLWEKRLHLLTNECQIPYLKVISDKHSPPHAADFRFRAIVEMKGVYTSTGATYVWMCVKVFFCVIPDRSLMSTNVSQCISECERCCCYSSRPWWDDTICHCSDGFRIPQRSMCKRRLWKAVFVFQTRSHTHAQTHTDADTHTQRTAGADNKGVLIQLWGNKIRLQRNS